MQCSGAAGVCDANDEGTSVDCPGGECYKVECNGIISRTCGAPSKMVYLAGIDTKTSECQDVVWIFSPSQV